jgi:8-amino-7-oxononanoate synthase
MPALDDILQQKLRRLEARQQRRTSQETCCLPGARVIRAGRELVSFSGNDYLGLSQRPQVVAAAAQALKTYGAGAGASRLVTGNHPLYDELEAALAAYKRTDSACIFGSGYLANLGTIPALAGKGDLILADRLIHACMVDAVRLSSATFMRFPHNNMEHCRMLLEANRREHRHCLILSETVFSMDGDRAPTEALAALAREFDAWFMTDDAHGLGVSPPRPHPMSRPEWEEDIAMGTLSKAVGSYGGYICGSRTLIDYLKTSARSLIYSTALPPATVAASIAALKIIAEEPELTAKPLQNARHFTSLLGTEAAQSAIVPVMLKENDKALAASALLEKHGFLVAAIRPPTVPEHTARLRFTFSALHTTEQIEAVAGIVRDQVFAI